MKLFLLVVSFLFLMIGCQKNSTGVDNSAKPMTLTTDKESYSQTDKYIVFRTRNGCLPLYYQKEQNGKWSNISDLNNCPYKGPDILDTLLTGSSFTQIIPSNVFHSTGSFRLVVKLSEIEGVTPKSEDDLRVFSNSFDIKK